MFRKFVQDTTVVIMQLYLVISVFNGSSSFMFLQTVALHNGATTH